MTTITREQLREAMVAVLAAADANGTWADADMRANNQAPLSFDEARTALVDWAKREIDADISDGVIPATVASFAELHDYVDANGYGLSFELMGRFPNVALLTDDGRELLDHLNAMQAELGDWIKLVWGAKP